MELPEELTRDDVKDILEEWEGFDTTYEGELPFYGKPEEQKRYSGLCEFVEEHYYAYDFFTFLCKHYDHRLAGYLQPDTLQTRIEVLEDILEKTKDE